MARRRFLLQAHRNTTPRLLPDAWVTGQTPASAASWSSVGKRSRTSPISARIWAAQRRPARGNDMMIRQVGDGPLGARRQLGDLGDEPFEQAGQGARDLAFGLRLGLAGQAGRGGPQAGQQLGRRASPAIAVLGHEAGEALLAEAARALRGRVAADEGE